MCEMVFDPPTPTHDDADGCVKWCSIRQRRRTTMPMDA
jgi:hypothetical protein